MQIYFIAKKKKKTCLWQVYAKFIYISKGVAEFGLQGNINRSVIITVAF